MVSRNQKCSRCGCSLHIADTETVFQAIEAALMTAARDEFAAGSIIAVTISRRDASLSATCNGQFVDPEELIERIGAQSAKQLIIQKIRELEREALLADENKTWSCGQCASCFCEKCAIEIQNICSACGHPLVDPEK